MNNQIENQSDKLMEFRSKFHIPIINEEESVYLCGNSLGLMPVDTKQRVQQELEDWSRLGVEGHFHAKSPWMPYHEILTSRMAKIVGSKDSEVVVMNGLTANLHLMMVSFYRPTPKRHKIVVEYSPFPSDRYAVISQLKFHGYSENDLIEIMPSDGGKIVSKEDIDQVFSSFGDQIALVLMAGVNYYTGQVYDIKYITALAKSYGCMVGFDLAHAAGNILLNLHNDGPDFACWCTYKYLNSGPGNLSGCFIHERHHGEDNINRFAGWWGNDKSRRFMMEDSFLPIQTAEGWQLSNPPILAMAAIDASLAIFEEAGMDSLIAKSHKMTAFLRTLLEPVISSNKISIITPSEEGSYGCQLSLQMHHPDKSIFNQLINHGVIADWREPDVIRIAPVPLYNSFDDLTKFSHIMHKLFL